MELQFQKNQVSFMHRPVHQVQQQEQTQQLRLTEQMPDVGKVLGCWGQVLLRGKEWNSDSIQLAGGVMVWVLYQPEDGTQPCHMEGWIPFQMKWDIPQSQHDGIMRIDPLLRSVDARAISARKLMVRCNVSVCAEAYVPSELTCYMPDEPDKDIQLLQKGYPTLLCMEAGEKPFVIEEEQILPGSCEPIKTPVSYWVRPELIDQKVMSDKAVFRGSLGVHLLYWGMDDRLHTWDFDVPFSQYTELERQYSSGAQISLWLCATSLEIEMQEDKLLLKAGMTGQYVIFDTQYMQTVEDAYSTIRPVTVQKEQITVPSILETKTNTVMLKQKMSMDGSVVDAVVLPSQPDMMATEEGVEARLECGVQMLYYDDNGTLQSAYKRWESLQQIPCGQDAAVYMQIHPTGKPQFNTDAEGITVTAELLTDATAVSQKSMEVVTGLQIGEQLPADPHRPSMILRRMDHGGLWDIAKECGTTVDAIRIANNLTVEPEPGKLLLIPVP